MILSQRFSVRTSISRNGFDSDYLMQEAMDMGMGIFFSLADIVASELSI